MTEQEILKALESILYSPSYNPGGDRRLFYIQKKQGTRTFYVFSNKTIERLLALSQKLVTETEKTCFWEIFKSRKPILFLQTFQKPLYSKVQRRIFKHQDFIFIFFIKSHKIDEALDIIDRNIIISSNKNQSLIVLLEALIFDPTIFNNLHLDRISLIVEKYRSFIYNWGEYIKVKRDKRAPIPTETIQINHAYENIKLSDFNECKSLLEQIEDAINQIRLAQLDSFLFEGINLEINRDQEKLKEIITTFGFDPILNESINKIDQKLYIAQDKFDFKDCIGLIRTFLNDLCVSTALEIAKKTNIPPSESIEEGRKMGKAMAYFRDKRVNFLSQEENKLLEALNSFMSHKGVHVLKSDREYARISRNMAIEIGLFLGKRLQKYLSDGKIKSKYI